MMHQQRAGSWAFILGIIFALISGLGQGAGISVPGAIFIPYILVILGIVVGFLNISNRDITDFLVAAIAFLAISVSAAGLNVIPVLGTYFVGVANNLAIFVAPAALVVALKMVLNLSKEPDA
tara:strand:+ start:124 stop:489 length:366 start_codon:yes stop_codon:yes gene_type:complete